MLGPGVKLAATSAAMIAKRRVSEGERDSDEGSIFILRLILLEPNSTMSELSLIVEPDEGWRS
jgi:hypothetical protein